MKLWIGKNLIFLDAKAKAEKMQKNKEYTFAKNQGSGANLISYQITQFFKICNESDSR
jgi:hypothetical protein